VFNTNPSQSTDEEVIKTACPLLFGLNCIKYIDLWLKSLIYSLSNEQTNEQMNEQTNK
jgi:hypothetical protein